MAGHSKWKNIQHRKGRQDAKRGKVFHKLAREVYVAARTGDPDPANNQKLRLAIAKAKAENMPNENIDRAIKKAAGGDEEKQYEEIVYEGYGPGGVAVLVEALTDNRNRTAAEVRHLFSKHDGNLGEAGSVAWMFERKGLLTLSSEQVTDEESLLLLALESGAEDLIQQGTHVEVVASPQELEQVKEAMEQESLQFQSAEVTFLPANKVPISDEQLSKLLTLLSGLEEQDDVQNVHTNFELNEQQWQAYLQMDE